METNIRKQNMERLLAAVVIKVRQGMQAANGSIKRLEAKRIDLLSSMGSDLSEEEQDSFDKEHYIIQEKINLHQEIIAEGQKALIENGVQTEEDLKYNY